MAEVNRLERLYAISDELRTVERDLAALRNAGLPAYPIDGPHGGVTVHTHGPAPC